MVVLDAPVRLDGDRRHLGRAMALWLLLALAAVSVLSLGSGASGVSVPGVLLTQIAALRALAVQGLDYTTTAPVAVIGHSPGGRKLSEGRRRQRSPSGRGTPRPPVIRCAGRSPGLRILGFPNGRPPSRTGPVA